jgi:hypothetical protein
MLRHDPSASGLFWLISPFLCPSSSPSGSVGVLSFLVLGEEMIEASGSFNLGLFEKRQ